MITMEKLKKIIEKKGFEVSDIDFSGNDVGWDLQQFTPLGEDWYVSIEHNNSVDIFAENLKKYANNFDIDVEVEPYIQMRGKRGVPESISDLLKDAKWKQRKLKSLAATVLNVIANDKYVKCN